MTISRGRKGIKVFTADKIQLRQNITHPGDRDLALDIAKPEGATHALEKAWGRDLAYVLDVQHSEGESARRRAELIPQTVAVEKSETLRQSNTLRAARKIIRTQQQTQRYGGGIGL